MHRMACAQRGSQGARPFIVEVTTWSLIARAKPDLFFRNSGQITRSCRGVFLETVTAYLLFSSGMLFGTRIAPTSDLAAFCCASLNFLFTDGTVSPKVEKYNMGSKQSTTATSTGEAPPASIMVSVARLSRGRLSTRRVHL